MTKQEAIAQTLKITRDEGGCRYAVYVQGRWNAGATLDDLATIFQFVESRHIVEVRPSGAVIYP